MDSKLSEKLKALAIKYETVDFLSADPSQFMHNYTEPRMQEYAAFIAASLSYGNRKTFIPKIARLLQLYLEEKKYLPDNDECFYRLHTNRMINSFLHVLDDIDATYGSLGMMIEKENVHTGLDAVNLITSYFATRNASDLIPKNSNSACKRICMFLRWMVRDHSNVDLGLWSHLINKSTLIIPLDTHVLQESQRLGLISSKAGSMATAIKLTNKLKEFFPEDPTQADFALFGIGINENSN